MKKFLVIISSISVFVLLHSCGGNEPKKEDGSQPEATSMLKEAESSEKEAAKAAHESKGVGKFTNVEIGSTLDNAMAETGVKVYDLKCSSCHKLTGEKLVGPGWKDVTSRRKAEWVMNFTTNTDEMLSKDAAAIAMLEECLVRMPNQSLTDADARAVYEFMRKNDGVK